MAPSPPINKDSDEKINSEENLINNIPIDVQNNDQDEFEIINEPTDDEYRQIPQNESEAQAIQGDSDDDNDDDDSEDDSDVEIDPDLHFEWLASSRSGPNIPNKKQESYNNSHILEHDIFELKHNLECEDIQLDEKKSEKINSLMANFKLPETAVPEWAKIIPEDIWKKNLLDSLNAKKTDLFDQKKESQN
ncbi:unnamed protein product [Brachionus calyciflorus]|uniref:Male-enhanced antigen 1 n=1 Tax=Brachionus calyciflorus TaxID=104777 RepID=A0A814HD33_9BILA|nr:unnamed protein product [Brachionus calyciflorus]